MSEVVDVGIDEACDGMVGMGDREKRGALCHRDMPGQSRAARLLPLLTHLWRHPLFERADGVAAAQCAVLSRLIASQAEISGGFALEWRPRGGCDQREPDEDSR